MKRRGTCRLLLGGVSLTIVATIDGSDRCELLSIAEIEVHLEF